ncbi:MAG: hypothetical protein GY715_22015 [Planctomycetes bacterium]|nr:hypothetical protein [Planctomycetota bacterium]
MSRNTMLGALLGSVALTMMIAPAASATADGNKKGSLLIWSKIDIQWDAAGFLTQDTFLALTNDYPGDVLVQLYFINGDPPLDTDPITGERAHPGWNWVDNLLPLTGDQPVYWCALTGQPAGGGLSPFTALDPGFPPGRPDPETGGRMLRGFVVGWAVNSNNEQIAWDHLNGEATIVNYLDGAAWKYRTWAYDTNDASRGDTVGTAGHLNLDGDDYEESPSQLLLNFQAVGSPAYSGPRLVVADVDLTLFPIDDIDMRQEGCGPPTTKMNFDVWNMNEIKFSGQHRCVTCWDQTRFSDYGAPNHFTLEHLQTNNGKARIDGIASQVCDVDVDPNDGFFPFDLDYEGCVRLTPDGQVPQPGNPASSHPDDVASRKASILGVFMELLSFDGGTDIGMAGATLGVMGSGGDGDVYYDVLSAPPEAVIPSPGKTDAERIITGLQEEIRRAPAKPKRDARRTR